MKLYAISVGGVKAIGPATCCDEMSLFPVIVSFKRHRRPSQNNAGISSKIAAVWPVSYSRWDIFIISCDGDCCDVIINIQLSASTHISHDRTLKAHHFAENRLQIGE